ncbi:uncharacterized protein Z519_06740 [Cladophialophora bantiana CBS 173.52]|uniref:SMP-30/Gluconolactonase/LRE-like region domain-containing protein n=1 Tax=Cladophialophora bantiana (strain ATCC 10958 / CBS 173.52 / CDC B-1940 / NIH 8579) TaxID=1442370 RepID=A0A0D2ESP0_CLAB1|nr:uncharacterized protein Z519_06740 [Cladophialophora bantiana CBS 173.52]KIW92891.1 hypothetical protein Z519_06740 [Cladophialophora bantiana CBS 173.52]
MLTNTAAVLPYHFNGSISNNNADYDVRNISVPNATSFDLLVGADLVVFDRERGSYAPVMKDIFFTDPAYSRYIALTDTTSQLPSIRYPGTPDYGADGLGELNSIAFSPDGSTPYISEIGAVSGTIDPRLGSEETTYNTTGKRVIYAWGIKINERRV